MTDALGRVIAIGRHELRVLRHDPSPLIVLILMPLAIIAFLRPAFRPLLVQEGYPQANGSEQVVPGLTVMFSFFVVAMGAITLYREHGWSTWDRLRASGARLAEIIIGKLLPVAGLLLVQFVAVFTLSWVLFGLRFRGTLVAVALVWAGLTVCLMALTAMTFALCRSDQQMVSLTNVATMVFAGLGGALVPVQLLPDWASAIGRFTPGYWAIRGFDAVILDGAGVTGVAGPVAVLLGFAVLLAGIASLRLRMNDRKGTQGY